MAEAPESAAAENRVGGGRSRLHFLLLVGLAAVALLLSFDPALLSYWSLRIYSVLVALLPGVVVAVACACCGYGLIKPAADHLHPGERLLLAFVSGMGIVSVVVACFGFVGILTRSTAWFVILPGLVGGLVLLKPLLTRQHCSSCGYQSGRWQPISVGIVLSVACAIAVLFALTPPLLFDVTEYHLGAWSDYLNVNGSVQFAAMPHNFYARFPFPIESLYFLGLFIAPDMDTAPKVFNAICVFACGYAAAVFVRWCGINRTGQLLAALAAVTLPVMLEVSVDAMIDAPVALLVITAFMSAMRAAGKFPTQNGGEPGLFLPSLLIFSTALCSKYTVAQLYLLPWLLICLPALMSRAARPSVGKVFVALLVAAGPPLMWFGKNWALYGNPLEPFFVSIFRPDDVAGIAREKFYVESHFPQSVVSASYWTTLLPRLHEFVWLYLALCTALFFVRRRALAVRVLAFAGISFLLWNLVRESQDRFLLPVMVLVASTALAAVMSIRADLPRRALATMVLIFCSLQTATYALKLKESGAVDYVLNFYPGRDAPRADDPATPREVFLEENLGDLGKVLIDLRKQVPDAKLLLVYEARPYLFRRNAEDAAVAYNVVWDDSVLLNTIRGASNVAEAWQRLADAGYTHLLINRQELLRYIQQYARKQQLLRLGVGLGEDPRLAYSATPHPEDLYPPFYRDQDWEKLRTIVHELLSQADAGAIVRHGLPSPGAGIQPIDIIVAPVPAESIN